MNLKFYLDTHIDKQVAIQLRRRNILVVHCEEVGMAEVDDEQHLRYASENELVLITKDEGFRRRHFEWLKAEKNHAGIFFCRDRDIPAIGAIVDACLSYYELIASGAGSLEDIQNEFFSIC